MSDSELTSEADRIAALRAEVRAFDEAQEAARQAQAEAAVASATAFIEADWFQPMIEAATAAKASLAASPRLASLFGGILETALLLPRFTEDARRDALNAISNQARQASE